MNVPISTRKAPSLPSVCSSIPFPVYVNTFRPQPLKQLLDEDSALQDDLSTSFWCSSFKIYEYVGGQMNLSPDFSLICQDSLYNHVPIHLLPDLKPIILNVKRYFELNSTRILYTQLTSQAYISIKVRVMLFYSRFLIEFTIPSIFQLICLQL